MHCGSRDAVQRRDLDTYVHNPFIGCTGEKAYTCRPLLILREGSGLTDAGPITRRLKYVAFPRTFESYHVLTSFEY